MTQRFAVLTLSEFWSQQLWLATLPVHHGPCEMHWVRRLNFKRSLADTTAESYASVKHRDHIDLGLCYFFAERWADSAGALEPLWAQESENLPFLYVLANAAHRAGQPEWDDRATAQLLKIGNDSAEYHLFAGKYHLNREEYDMAIAEFQAAAKINPTLAFIHFNLGVAHLKKQAYSQAREEFLKDVSIEPDLALNYDQLGEVYWQMQDDANAEKSYREAIRRDSRLVSSHLGLAKIYQRQSKYAAALTETDQAVKLDPERTESHYVRGQVLLRLGRKEEAKKEMAAAANLRKDVPVPSPELMQEPQ